MKTEAQREKERLAHNKWAAANPDKVRAGRKRWEAANPEKVRSYKAEYRAANREKLRAADKVRRQANRDKDRASHLLRSYGLTVEQYNAMCAEQNYKCKICQKVKKLYVDHCHDTDKVRGLLCNNCNNGLGKFGDNLNGLSRAVNYLESFEKRSLS